MSTNSLKHPLTRALLVLTFTTGVIDAASYLGLGHVFTANMTGNIVLLGFGIAGGSGLPVISPLVSLAAFLAGAALGGRMALALPARTVHLSRSMLIGAIAGALLLKVHLAAVLGLAALLAILTWLVFIPAATSVERAAEVTTPTGSI